MHATGIYQLYQWLRSIFDPFGCLTALEEAEIIPGKDADTRIKPFLDTSSLPPRWGSLHVLPSPIA
jgi:hypothetical protein